MVFLKLALDDLFNKNHKLSSNKTHLDLAMKWLISCFEMAEKKGISKGYFLFSGWKEVYPEVTGYCIPTFFEYYKQTKKREHKEIALKMADWLLSIQLKNGAFPASNLTAPLVFDTAQAIHGLIAVYKRTKNKKYLKSAVKAADWLVSIQESNGSWKKFAFRNKTHAYHSQVALALLFCFRLTKNRKYLESAKQNLDWVLSNQLSNGWFKNCAFYIHPSMHTMAYTLEGLLIGGKILRNNRYVSAAKKTADVLLDLYKQKGLYCSYDKNWKYTTRSICLTGSAQISIIWLILYSMTKERKYLKSAMKINNFLKKTQIASQNPDINGGIKGSHPIYGAYEPFRVLSWAAKFFVDVLMLEEELKNVK